MQTDRLPNSPSSFARITDVPASALDGERDALDDLIFDRRDALVVRGAIPRDVIERAQQRLQSPALDWSRPNQPLPSIDVLLLGHPAFPNYSALRGPTPEEHLAADQRFRAMIDGLFAPEYDGQKRIEEILGAISGGRPVSTLPDPPGESGRRYQALTVRAFFENAGTTVHVDDHYALPFYQNLAPHLDGTTIVSIFAVLQAPESGGELSLFNLKHGRDPEPRLPNGRWDDAAIESGYERKDIILGDGDLIVFPAGRIFHKVQPVRGAKKRITIGSLLTLAEGRSQVWYWG